MPDPADLGLRAATAAIATVELSAAELVDACLARAEAPATLGAFALLDADGARREAVERDHAPGAGGQPLHGAPVGIKDIAGVTRLCGPVNSAGLAAVSVFAGLDAAGLPLGAQFVARDEATALAAAVAHEALAGEPPRPPLLAGANQRSGESP